ncbi:MAG: hypothetical protein ACSW8H_01720 [bacterium]
MENINVKITFLEGPLGTSPNDEDVYRNFIGSKAPDAESLEEEVAALGVDAVAEKGMTVFPRDAHGNPIFWDYQIKGFMKDTCGMLSRVGGKGEDGKKKAVNESSKMKAYKKIIDGLIFVSPRQIPIQMNGDMGVCQRPLRAQTMQGERVTLAMSEACPAFSTISFTVSCLSAEHAAAVREWLNYGFLRGLGQWRNSGRGKFVWDELDEKGEVIGGNARLEDVDRLALIA